MRRDPTAHVPEQRIAVVGSGIAGLSAAWLLSHAHDVTLFEAADRLGGHSNTVDVDGPRGAIAVDTGFIVYNQRTYPNLAALFDHLGVATQPSDMSFGVSIDDGTFEYAGSDLLSLFAQRRNLVRPRFWRMLVDTLRFYRHGPALLLQPDAEEISLGAYLRREGYSRAFIDDHLLPMIAAIWSAPAANAVLDHPAAAYVRFAINHGLMQIAGRPRWRTLVGGSRAYVQRLAAALVGRVRLATAVRRIHRLPADAGGDRPAGVMVEDASGATAAFDQVVIGAHADDALALLADPTAAEASVLGAFTYTANTAVLHSDRRLMPRRRSAWASWNALGQGGTTTERRSCVTYWMNRLQSLDDTLPLFVTLNPLREPCPGLVHATVRYEHPAYDVATPAAQRRLPTIQGVRRTWFCGSYFGAGFHEDALAAGLAVAEAIGGVHRPWSAVGQPLPTEGWLARSPTA